MKGMFLVWGAVLVAELLWLWSILQQQYSIEGLVFLILMIIVTLVIGFNSFLFYKLEKDDTKNINS